MNKTERWIADHALPIFGVIAVLIVLGAAAVFYTYQRQGDTAEKVQVIAPQVTKINRAICDRGSLINDVKAKRCAERIRIGLVNCRRVSRCRAAYLALATYPPPAKPTSTTPSSEEGGAIQQPSNNGHQQPGPSGGQQEGGQEASPTPSEPEGGAGAGQGEESPGNGAQGSQDGSSSSGAGVEVCALERTCVGVEVGLDPKGLLP